MAVKPAQVAAPVPLSVPVAEPAFVPTAGGKPLDLIEVHGGPAMTEAEAKKLE